MPWFVGIERTEIHWFPTIDKKKCVKCGMCMNCGRGVFAWEADGPVVRNPYECVVGCSTCANLCQGKAISFPPLGELRAFYRKHKMWNRVKEALVKAGKIPDASEEGSQR